MEVSQTITDRAAEKFLKNGTLDGVDRAGLAQACSRVVRRMTQSSIAKASRLVERFVRHARPYRGVLLQTALRAQGWCYLIGGKYRRAEKAYLEARSLLTHDPLWRGRVDRVLIDVYMYLGDYREAGRRARQVDDPSENRP